jgi:V-type H+-transporting ATPase proteolipid subunit
MAAVLAIYGLVVSVMIANSMGPETHLFKAFVHMGAGLSVGIASLGAGFTIGITGDAGVRGICQQPKLFIGMMLMQIFAEVLGAYIPKQYKWRILILVGLYGMIIALLMLSKASSVTC